MEQFRPEDNFEVKEEKLETEKLSASQLLTAVSQAERADEILLLY